MNRLSGSRRTAVLRALVSGLSIRASCRMIGVAKGTALKLLVEIGTECTDYQNRHFVQLPCRVLQCDNIWSFAGDKERNVTAAEKGWERGDVWTWTAACADTKLVPCWHIGARDAEAAVAFVEDLASRLANRVQLTTDGLRAYLTATRQAVGWNVADYAMLQKLYGPAPETGRYDPPGVFGPEKRVIMGPRDGVHISTPYADRASLTMRMSIRRSRRLTNDISKKLENHMHAVSLHFMNYNFCRPHQILTKAARGIHTTPAIAAGVTDRVWKVEDVIELADRVSN